MKKKVWDVTVKDNPNRVVMGENDEFYTTDTEAYLVFKLEDDSFNPASAVLTLENRNDGSLKNETVDVVDGLIEWEMPQRYIEHFGNWQGQLVYEDIKDGQPELYTSAAFTFVVNAHIGDKKKPSLVEIENWEKFIRDGTELIETWEYLEALREENERQRQENEQGRVFAESVRVANEEERELNEFDRIESEIARKKELEKARYSRFSNHTYNEIGERLDTIESNTFTSHIFDESGAPGPKSLLRGNEGAGFFGFVQPEEMGELLDNPEGSQEFNGTNLATLVGITQGTAINSNTPWMKFISNGEIIFVPVKPLRHSVNWDSIYSAGVVYGDGTIGVTPPSGRSGNKLSVDGANSSFLIEPSATGEGFLRSGAVIAGVGETIVTRGFAIEDNNGEFVISEITDTAIKVNATLSTETKGRNSASIYKKGNETAQDAEVTVGKHKYKVRLLKGASQDPLNSYNDVDRGLVGSGSEWNGLILPLHEEAKLGSWAYESFAGTVEDWGVGLTDKDLVTHHALGTGSYSWMQETSDTDSHRRVLRGNNGASFGNHNVSSYVGSNASWRPVLQLNII